MDDSKKEKFVKWVQANSKEIEQFLRWYRCRHPGYMKDLEEKGE